MLAEVTNDFAGQWAFLIGGVVANVVLAGIGVLSFFATRREVDLLEKRVAKLEETLDDKTERLHKRVNRLLAGQMLIAGRVGCELEQHSARIEELMAKFETEEP